MQKNINICLNININMNPAIQIFLGYIMADFLGGFFHWFEDTYLDYDSKIPLFNGISKHNEMHHYCIIIFQEQLSVIRILKTFPQPFQ
jgi:hypothetical protein